VADVAQLRKALGNQRFDRIICDAPCSGSGTWARTPEQFYFFHPETLASFTALQTTIATNVASYLRPGGTLYYITCSVFVQENEAVTGAVCGKTGLQLVRSRLINGISMRADNMFIAELVI
jgi:16S rRNA (cytosine967-C5)-methyltransferase